MSPVRSRSPAPFLNLCKARTPCLWRIPVAQNSNHEGRKAYVSEVHRAVIGRITRSDCGSEAHGSLRRQRYFRRDVKLDLRLQSGTGRATCARLADLGREAEFHIRPDQPPIALHMKIDQRERGLVGHATVG